MNKLLFLLVVPFFISACIQPEGEEVITEIIDETDTYRFHDISYSIEEGDYIRPLEEITHQETIHRNYTDEEVKVEYTFFKGAKDYSVFHGMESADYKLIDDGPVQLLIPSSIDSEGHLYVKDGDRQNIFGENYYPSFDADSKTLFTIGPQSGLDITYNECWNELRLTYTATFIGEEYKRIITITGKWEGKQLWGHEYVSYIHYDLDPDHN